MKTTVAACAAAILTSASTSAYASPAGLGGGGHPTGTGFGNHVAASVGLTGNRWGPNNTTAFGQETNGWGPNETRKRPGYVATDANNVIFKCPCVVAFDPFKPGVAGGVPLNEAKVLKQGVIDQADFDAGGFPSIIGLTIGTNAMGAVWGQHFDPHARKGERFIVGPDRGSPPFSQNVPNTLGSVR